jgi:hypothetical protein
MITESELEAQAITWFQDTGWEFLHGPYRLAEKGKRPRSITEFGSDHIEAL